MKAKQFEKMFDDGEDIAHRVGRYLERQGLLERDTGHCYLTPEAMVLQRWTVC